jgi:hypothetical protein
MGSESGRAAAKMSLPFGSWWAPWREAGETLNLGSWLDAWSETTRWWSHPGAVRPDAWSDAGRRLLAELVAGVTGRFEGREIEVVRDQKRFRASLDWLRLRRADGRNEVTVELRDVQWDGWEVETLSVIARSIRVTPPLTIDATDVEMVGRARLESVVAQMDGAIAGWRLGIDREGHVEARSSSGRMTFVVEPAVSAHRWQLELRGARWRGLALAAPSWLRLSRSGALPRLAQGLWIEEASRRGMRVGFRARLPAIRQELDPGQLRDAIRRGQSIRLFGRPQPDSE